MMAVASMWEWVRRHRWRTVAFTLLFLVSAFALRVCAAEARLDRNWDEHLAVMPKVEMTGEAFALDPVMDWAYTADGPATKGLTAFSARFSELRDVWFMVEPQPGQAYAAHTLILFEFADDRIVGVTVEARLEKGETYDAVEGTFNKFELGYFWASARELLTRRATFLKKEVYVYPLRLTEEQKQRFLKAMLERTVEVSTHPRFYNTITSNCTNELAKVAGVPWHYSWVLTGYSPQRLFETKLIPGESFEAAKATAFLSPEIISWNALSSADFDRALLAELRRRNGP
jgi:hypothetical protein